MEKMTTKADKQKKEREMLAAFLRETPKEELDKFFAEVDALPIKGPTYDEYLKALNDMNTNRDQYQRNLDERQKKHLDEIKRRQDAAFTPCAHDACTSCHGTGVKVSGEACFHHLSCKCRKCNPTHM